MLLPAVSVLVVAQPSSEIPEVLMNNPVFVSSVLFKEFYIVYLIVFIFYFFVNLAQDPGIPG